MLTQRSIKRFYSSVSIKSEHGAGGSSSKGSGGMCTYSVGEAVVVKWEREGAPQLGDITVCRIYALFEVRASVGNTPLSPWRAVPGTLAGLGCANPLAFALAAGQ